jgi:hypothetical protein
MMVTFRSVLALAAVLSTVTLADSAMAAQQNAMAAQKFSFVEPPLPHSEMLRMIADDEKQAKAGSLPLESVKIDMEMDKLGDEGRAAFARHDDAAKQAWGKKMQVLLNAQVQAIQTKGSGSFNPDCWLICSVFREV